MTVIPPDVVARFKLWILVIPIIATHLGVVLLGAVDRLVFAPIAASPYPLLDDVVDSHVWVWLNAVAFLGVGAATIYRHRGWVISALSFSSAILVVWGLLAGLWGLLSPVEPTLLGPLLAVIIGLFSRLLAFGVAEGVIRPGPGTGQWR